MSRTGGRSREPSELPERPRRVPGVLQQKPQCARWGRCRLHGRGVCLSSVYLHARGRVRVCVPCVCLSVHMCLHMCTHTCVHALCCAGNRCLCWCALPMRVYTCVQAHALCVCVRVHVSVKAHALPGEEERAAKPLWWHPARCGSARVGKGGKAHRGGEGWGHSSAREHALLPGGAGLSSAGACSSLSLPTYCSGHGGGGWLCWGSGHSMTFMDPGLFCFHGPLPP